MTVAKIEKTVNVIVSKPLAWMLYLAWLLVCLLAHWSRLFLVWLGQRCNMSDRCLSDKSNRC